MTGRASGRPNQKLRTRKDLLKAAGELLKSGRKPSIDEIAAAAMISRATAYRYFPNVDALLAEATVDIAVLDAGEFFEEVDTGDAITRLELVDTALHDLVLANEASIRMMLAHSLGRPLRGDQPESTPPRQNRRTPLIAIALEPERKRFTPAMRKILTNALALIIGTEGMVVIKDVLHLDDAEARKTKRWAIRALVEAARKTA